MENQRKKDWYKNNRIYWIEQATLYNKTHREQYLQYQREYWERNKIQLIEKRKEYRKQWRLKQRALLPPKPVKEKPVKEPKIVLTLEQKKAIQEERKKEKKLKKFFVSKEEIVLITQQQEEEQEEEEEQEQPQITFSFSSQSFFA